MSQSSDSSDDYWVAFEPSPSDAESGIYCDEEFSEQQSVAKVPPDSEEVEQQSKANPHDDSGLDLPRLPAVTNAESLKETILEPQTIVTEFGRADPQSCADVAHWDQQGESDDVANVRVFTPRNFSFQDSNPSELGAPSDAAPSDAAANEVEKRTLITITTMTGRCG